MRQAVTTDAPSDRMKPCACVMCAFYAPVTDARGECRIAAPMANVVNGDTFWPVVRPRDWCGEWQSVDL